MAQHEFQQFYPQAGWVEHDPAEILTSQMSCAVEALGKAGARPRGTTVATYLGINGVYLSWSFPFITLPLHAAPAVGGVTLFGTQAVTSVPESMPLLLLLALWGLVAAFRRRPALRTRTTTVLLVASAAPCGVILIFGFLDDRFLGDFVPFSRGRERRRDG